MFGNKILFLAVSLALVALAVSQQANVQGNVVQNATILLNQTGIPGAHASSQPQVAQATLANQRIANAPTASHDSQGIDPHSPGIVEVTLSRYQNKPSDNHGQQAGQTKEGGDALNEQLLSRTARGPSHLESMTEEQRHQYEQKMIEESRLAYERINKEREEAIKKEEEEYQRLLREEKLTKSQQIIARESEQIKTESQKVNVEHKQMDEFLFDLEDNEQEQFKITLPVDQNIFYLINIFENRNGVFAFPQEFEDDSSLTFYISQNEQSVIIQNNFYFGTMGNFDGKANASYFFKFINYAGHKLVNFRLMAIVEQNHLYDILTVQDVADHGWRISNVKQEVSYKLHGLQVKSLLQKQNRRTLTQNLSKYHIYTISEIVIMGVVCVLQLQFVQKLLERASVV